LPTTFAGVQISLETALLTGFDRTLRAAFREVVAVPSPDVALAHQAIDVLIVPELRRVDFSTPGFGAASLLLGTDWSAIGGSGKLVWRDTITAHGADACNSKWPGKAGAPCVKRLCENVLQQLFEQVYARLVEVDWEKVASKR